MKEDKEEEEEKKKKTKTDLNLYRPAGFAAVKKNMCSTLSLTRYAFDVNTYVGVLYPDKILPRALGPPRLGLSNATGPPQTAYRLARL